MGNIALIVDPAAPCSMRLAEAPAPQPGAGEAVVAARYASLNHGDLNDATSGRLEPGDVLGSDVSGMVIRAAADGSGPPEGATVVGLARGAFAQRVALATGDIAVFDDDDVDPALAACLPVAGLAALRTLRASGSLLGRTVLVTGASGGVGGFAVQLAARAGARVIASVGAPERGAGLEALGAHEVVVGLDGVTAADVIIDNVGGPQLVAAWRLLGEGGVLHSVGWTSGQPAVLGPYATVGPAKTWRSYLTVTPVGKDLATLVALLASSALEVQVGLTSSLAEYEAATAALRERRVRGKVLLDIGAGNASSRAASDVADA